MEVDFIVGDKQLAVEVKGSGRVHEGDIRHLKAFGQEGPVGRSVVVSLEPYPRQIAPGIDVLPYGDFLKRLWNKEFLK